MQFERYVREDYGRRCKIIEIALEVAQGHCPNEQQAKEMEQKIQIDLKSIYQNKAINCNKIHR